MFVNHIYDNIQKQTLILPQGAVGTLLGTEPITAQNANGAVFVAAATTPVLVRANFDNARSWGFEHQGRYQLSNTLSLRTVFTYYNVKDTKTDLAPNIEGGIPAPDGYLRPAVRARRRQVVGAAVPARGRRAVEPVDARSRRSPHRGAAHAQQHARVLPQRRHQSRLGLGRVRTA